VRDQLGRIGRDRSDVARDVQIPGPPTFAIMRQRGRSIIGVKDDQSGLDFTEPATGKFAGFDIEIARQRYTLPAGGPGSGRAGGTAVRRPATISTLATARTGAQHVRNDERRASA
jgi:hypothetical protein